MSQTKQIFKAEEIDCFIAEDKTVLGDDGLLEIIYRIEDLTYDRKIRNELYKHHKRVKKFYRNLKKIMKP